MIFVHVGLGKTATTTLQRHVFPNISRDTKIQYDKDIRNVLSRACFHEFSKVERQYLQKYLNNVRKDTLISFERLVNWNPTLWVKAADRNLEIFGSGATILLTMRDPAEYMRSMFQEKFLSSRFVRPHQFFCSNEEYLEKAVGQHDELLECFNVDAFDLQRLYEIYAQRFDRVICVELSQIQEMRFLADMLLLSEEQRRVLCQSFKDAPVENRALSRIGMKVSFLFEPLLKRVDAVSTAGGFSVNVERKGWVDTLLEGLPKLERPKKTLPYLRYKALKFARKGLNRVAILKKKLRWRNLVQNGIDKIVPYEKYELPKDIYRNAELDRKNREFISKLRREGYLDSSTIDSTDRDSCRESLIQCKSPEGATQ